jgi:hypothetical protein
LITIRHRQAAIKGAVLKYFGRKCAPETRALHLIASMYAGVMRAASLKTTRQ